MRPWVHALPQCPETGRIFVALACVAMCQKPGRIGRQCNRMLARDCGDAVRVFQLLHRRAILTILAATQTNVTCDPNGEKRISQKRDQNRKLAHTEIIAGEIGLPTPKEQPPRKLSGKRTAMIDVLWKEARIAPADGITFSGKHTEGAPKQRQSGRNEVLQCGLVIVSSFRSWRRRGVGEGARGRTSEGDA